jgi:hypothetical protein
MISFWFAVVGYKKRVSKNRRWHRQSSITKKKVESAIQEIDGFEKNKS